MRIASRHCYACLLIVFVVGCRQTNPIRQSPDVPARVGGLDEFNKKSGFLAFLQPGESQQTSELLLLEPYRRGRIPVVFVHGLLSSPATWKTMIAELQRDETIRARYQFWVFRYPTGGSYMQASADLRERLRSTLDWLDPSATDASLRRMVLIGHSMGGLVSKLQVTHSDDRLWKAVARRPFDELKADTKVRSKVKRILFFEPLPFVQRVVFIATPHRGSQWTESSLGKLGRWFVEFPERTQRDFMQLLQLNNDIFVSTPTRVPTSIDHLAPDSPILQATRNLRFRRGVKLHSIVANGPKLPDGTAGDGVVSLASAELPAAHSTLQVQATHTSVNGNAKAVVEVLQILKRHAVAREVAEPVLR